MGLNAGAVLRSGAGPGLQRLLALGAAEMAERVWIAQRLGLLWAIVLIKLLLQELAVEMTSYGVERFFFDKSQISARKPDHALLQRSAKGIILQVLVNQSFKGV